MSKFPAIQHLLDALDEPAMLVGDGRTLAANAQARALLGDDIAGRDVRIALRQPAILNAIGAGGARDVALAGIGRTDRPWQVMLRPLGDSTVLLRFSDRSAAVAAERMRVDFVANASHELRTPLATIAGYAETLEDPDVEGDARIRFAAVIRSEAARMQRIIEDLMSLSRIESERFVLPRTSVDLAALAGEAVAQIAPLAERRGCTVTLDAAPVPRIRGDEGQLLQVLDNLLSNAVRYGCNARSSAVRLEVRAEPDRVTVRVIDHGDGIARHLLPRLTERFYRVDPARSRDSGGTGLGLAIAKHILERHRASLEFDTAPGRGMTVTLGFPTAVS